MQQHAAEPRYRRLLQGEFPSHGGGAAHQSCSRMLDDRLCCRKAGVSGFHQQRRQGCQVCGSTRRVHHPGFDIGMAAAIQLLPHPLTQGVVRQPPVSHLQGQLQTLMSQIKG